MCSETLIKACEEPVVAGGVTFLGRTSHSHDISRNPQENFQFEFGTNIHLDSSPSSYFPVCTSSTSFLNFLVPPTWDAGIGGKEQKQREKIGDFKQKNEASVFRRRNLKQPSVKCFCVTAASSVLCLVSSLLLHFVITVRCEKRLMYLVLMQFIMCHLTRRSAVRSHLFHVTVPEKDFASWSPLVAPPAWTDWADFGGQTSKSLWTHTHVFWP